MIHLSWGQLSSISFGLILYKRPSKVVASPRYVDWHPHDTTTTFECIVLIKPECPVAHPHVLQQRIITSTAFLTAWVDADHVAGRTGPCGADDAVAVGQTTLDLKEVLGGAHPSPSGLQEPMA